MDASVQKNSELTEEMKKLKMGTALEAVEFQLEATKNRLKEETRARRQAEMKCNEMEAERRLRQTTPKDNHNGLAVSKVNSDVTEMTSNMKMDVPFPAKKQGTEASTAKEVAYVQVVTELENVRNELVQARRKLAEHQQQVHGSDKLKLTEMELDEQIKKNQILEETMTQYETMLKESKEETTKLTEEVVCLRDVLPFSDRVDSNNANINRTRTEIHDKIEREVRSTVIHEANRLREQEVNALREQFKKVFKENTLLREKVEKLQSGKLTATDNLGIEESRMKREIEKLTSELRETHEKHRTEMAVTEKSWKAKIEEIQADRSIPEDILQAMEHEMRDALESASSKVAMVTTEQKALEKKVQDLESELSLREVKLANSTKRWQEYETNQKASRDEILRLKKKNAHLTSELEYMAKIMSRMDDECERLTTEHSAIKAELDVMVRSSGKRPSAYTSKDVIKLKEELNKLTTKFEKLSADYVTLLEEMETTRQKHLNEQEATAAKNDSEIQFLTQKMVEREEKIQVAEMEKRALTEKLRAATERFDIEVVELAVNKQKEKSSKVIEKLETQLFEERELVKSLRSALKDSPDASPTLTIKPLHLQTCMEDDEEVQSASMQSLENGTDSNVQSFDSSSGNPTIKMSNMTLRGVGTFSTCDSENGPSDEQTKEELRKCKARLEASLSDVYALKDALEKMTAAFEELKLDHDFLLDLSQGAAPAAETSKELQEVKEEKNEMANKIRNIQSEIENKEKEVASLKQSLKQKETELNAAIEENEELRMTIEKSIAENKVLQEELDQTEERFLEIRAVADKDGRDVAEAEAREQMAALEREKRDLQEQLEIALADCTSLRACLEVADATLKTTIATRNFRGKAAKMEMEQQSISTGVEGGGTTDTVDAMKEEIRTLIENKADLLKRVDEALSSSSSTASDNFDRDSSSVNVSSEAELSTSDSDIQKTIEVLNKIDALLSPFESDNNNNSLHARVEHQKRLFSASERAQVIKRKVSFVTYALKKSKKEHSDVLAELSSAKQTIASLASKLEEHKSFQTEIETLREKYGQTLERLAASENKILVDGKTGSDKILELQGQLQISDKECREFEESATRFELEAESLGRRIQELESEKAELEQEIVVLKHQIGDLIGTQTTNKRDDIVDLTSKTDDEPPSLDAQNESSEDFLALAQRYIQENAELQSRLRETESTLSVLARARDAAMLHRDDRDVILDYGDARRKSSGSDGVSSSVTETTTTIELKQPPESPRQYGSLLDAVEKLSGESSYDHDDIETVQDTGDIVTDMKPRQQGHTNDLINKSSTAVDTAVETRMEGEDGLQERE